MTEQMPKMYPKFDHLRFCLTDKSVVWMISVAKKEALQLLLHVFSPEMIFSEKGSLVVMDFPWHVRLWPPLWPVADYDNLVDNYFAFKF